MNEKSTRNLSSRNLPWVIGITGASGTVYARRLIEVLTENLPETPLEVVVSDAALRVMREEESIKVSTSRLSAEDLIGRPAANVTFHSNQDIGASIASGSYRTAGMIVIPCSMKTLSGIANGYSSSLIERAADVVIKESRRLIVVPRETPLSTIHLENMLKLSRLGAIVAAAMPGFYHQPASISDLVDMQVLRVIDQMGLEEPLRQDLVRRWDTAEERRRRKLACV